METENTEQANQEESLRVDEMSVEDAFNLIVGLARNAKLTYKEHMVVSKATKTVLGALNEKMD